MRYTGPKDRLSRREGVDLFGKGAKLTRLGIPPGVHGPKGLGKQSGYAKQLREKQKAKRIYDITEKQFAAYVEASQKNKNLIELLERRLDNVIYRLGFAPTRPAARQIVNHGHVLVDGKRVDIPSFRVQEGQMVSLDSTALNIPEIKKSIESAEHTPAAWLDRKAAVGKIKRLPVKQDINEPISEQEIIEFYSR